MKKLLMIVSLGVLLSSCGGAENEKLKSKVDSLQNELQVTQQMAQTLTEVGTLMDSIDASRQVLRVNMVEGTTYSAYTSRMKDLNNYVKETQSKIGELEKKRLEVQGWVETQRAMLLAANQGLVDIYAKMDAEAAAVQLGQIDVRTAVSILRQLKPRDASAILTAMEPGKAALLVKAIAAALQDKKPGQGT